MQEVTKIILSSFLENLDKVNSNGTIYLFEKWTSTSEGFLVERTNHEEDLPLEYKSAKYLLEVSLIRDVVEVFYEWHGKRSIKQLCKAVIYYAVNDAYMD